MLRTSLAIACLALLAGCGSGSGSPPTSSTLIGAWRQVAWSVPGQGQQSCTGKETVAETSIGLVTEGCQTNETLSFTAGSAPQGFTGGGWTQQNVDSVNIYGPSGTWLYDGSGHLNLYVAAGGSPVTYNATLSGSTLTLSPIGTNSEVSYWQKQ